jgi:PAS domain S-box-containing protein
MMETENIVINRELFAAILNFVPAGISVATDASCREIIHNPAAAGFFRVQPWGNLSHSSDNPPPFRIYHEGKELAPDEMPIQLAAWQGLEVRDCEIDIIWDDGVHKTSLWNTSPLMDEQGNITGAVATFKDTTEQKRADKRNQHQNELLKRQASLLDLSMEAIFAWDLNGGIIYWNKGAEKMYGFSSEEAVGRLSHDLLKTVHPIDTDEIKSVLARDRAWSGEIEHTCKDGRKLIIETRHQVIADELGNMTVLETNRDITRRKRAEKDLRRLNEELEERVAQRTEELTRSNGELNVLNEGLNALNEEMAVMNEEMTVINEELTANSRQLEEEIVRRKEYELELQAANEKVTNILESISDGFIALDHEWRYTYLNVEARRQMGIKDASEVIGQVIWDAFPSINTTANEIYHQAVSEQTAVSLEIYSQVTGRWLDIHAYPTPDGLSVYFLDITERKQAEETLLLSEERFSKAFHSGPTIGVIRSLDDERIIDVNDNFLKTLEYEREEVIGHTPLDLGFWADREVFEQAFRELNNRTESRGKEVELRTRSGKIINALFSAVIIEIGGESCALVSFVDITERKRMEEKIKKLNRDLRRQADELIKINKELESFNYSISHDLRSPLRAINGFSQMISNKYQDKLDDEGRDELRVIRSESNRMGELINGLLNLSRLSRKELIREDLDLSSIATTIATELHRLEPERQVEFVITPGIRAYGDKVLLQSVLQNLLDNAWKFTGKHEKARIEFGMTEQEGKKAYFVRDDGTGFDMRYVSKLFGTFQRLHGADEFPGNGIGLAIIQRIVHHHGGQVWADSEVEKGATFYFTLPGQSDGE